MFLVDGLEQSYDEVQLLEYFESLRPGPIRSITESTTLARNCTGVIGTLAGRDIYEKTEDGWQLFELSVEPDLETLRSVLMGFCSSGDLPRSVRE